jgi:GntR family transcriptional regulator
MMFRVDTASDRPLFEQLATQVRLAILDGGLAQGDRLPAAGDVAAALGVNVHTVLHAYQVLRDEGLLELRRGRGAVVAKAPATDLAAVRKALAAFAQAARKAGLGPGQCVEMVREEMSK